MRQDHSNQNHIEPELESHNVANNANDKYIKDFNAFIGKIENSQGRQRLLKEIEEDKEIYDNRRKLLPKGTAAPLIGVSDYDFMIRKVQEALRDFPKLTGRLRGQDAILIPTTEALLELALETGGMEECWEDCLEAFCYQPEVIIEKGLDEDDKICFQQVDLSQLFFESDGVRINHGKGKRLGQNIKIAVKQVGLKYHEFLEAFPNMEGKVSMGAPVAKPNEARRILSSQDTQNQEFNQDSKIYVHFAYSVTDKRNPVMAVYAGADSTICQDANGKDMIYTGKDYPHWRGSTPTLPFFVLSIFGKRSIIGTIKDIAEAVKKAVNAGMRSIPAIANQFILALGEGADDDFIKQLQTSQEQQYLGRNPIIRTTGNVDIKTITPDLKIWEGINVFMTIASRFIRRRTGINIDEPSQNKQKVTLFVAQQAEENRANSELRRENKITLERLGEAIIEDLKRYGNIIQHDKIYYQIKGNDVGSSFVDNMTIEEALEIIKDWNGSLEAETDFKVNFSIPEQKQLQDDIEGSIITILNQVNYKTKEEIQPLVNSLLYRISRANMENIYNRGDIEAMIESRINLLNPQETPEEQEAPPQISQGVPMSPQKELTTEDLIGQDIVNEQLADTKAELAPTKKNVTETFSQ